MMFEEFPGSYEICNICFWEDDPVQLVDPWYEGGANKPSLADSQKNFLARGAIEERFLKFVRKPEIHEAKDLNWRLLQDSDREKITMLKELHGNEKTSLEDWCYWLK